MFLVNYIANNHELQRSLKPSSLKFNKTKNIPKNITNPKKTVDPNVSLDPDNNYDFHRLLSSDKADRKITNQQNLTQKNLINNVTNSNPNKYLLEIGKFNNLTAADRLKAQLALYGFEANIYSTTKSNLHTFTVVIGPFITKENAIAKKQELISSGFKNILIKNL